MRPDLESIVSPRAKLHGTALVVERKVCNVDLTGTSQLGGRRPEYVAVMPDHRIALHEAAGKVVRAAAVLHANTNSKA